MSLPTSFLHGLRSVASQRTIVAAGLLLIAPSLGLAVAVFSVVDGFLFRPLPYRAPSELALLQEQSLKTGQAYGTLAAIDFVAASHAASVAQATAFDRVARHQLRSSNEYEEVGVAGVDISFLSTLGINPVVGRGFGSDHAEGTVAVISHQFWISHFNGAAAVIGRTLSIADDAPVEIVGVLPASFVYPSFGRGGQPDVLVYRPQVELEGTSGGSRVAAIVRLHSGVSIRTAQAELATLAQEVRRVHVQLGSETTIRVVPALKGLFELYYPTFWMFSGAALSVLIATGASLGLVLIDQSVRRQGDCRLKMALGATRGDLIIESATAVLVIGIAASILAFVVVRVSFAAILKLLPAPIYTVMADGVSWRAFGVATCAALTVCLFAAIAPTAWLMRQDLAGSLQVGRTFAPARRPITQGFLVCQVAIAIVLVGTATMQLDYLSQRRIPSLGVQPDGAYVVDLDLRSPRLREASERYRVYLAVVESLRQMDWIEAAGAASAVPLVDTGVYRDAQISRSRQLVALHRVTRGYFQAVGVPLSKGRDFEAREESAEGRTALVNTRLAAQQWPGEDPIGRRLELDDIGLLTVVGVVGDVHLGFGQEAVSTVYVPVDQASFRSLTIIARFRQQAPTKIQNEVAGRLAEVARTPVIINTFESLANRPLAYPRFQTVLFSLLGLVTLVISVGGVFSVTSRAIAARFHEFAVRFAIGASRGQLIRLILRQHGWPLVAGAIIGVFAYTRSATLLSHLLPGISSSINWSFMLGVGIVITTTLFAMTLACRNLRDERTAALLKQS